MSGNGLGIALMSVTMLSLAVQDGFSRHLAGEYNVFMVVMIRYWFFVALALGLAARRAGGIRGTFATKQPGLQIARGLILAAEICVLVGAFVLLGLTESHAVFAICPLLVAALSGPVLGERVGLWRWLAIGAGFVGVIVILQPDGGVFAPAALIPVAAAAMFAIYALLTRLASRRDPTATSFLWTGTVGAVAMTGVGLWFWEPMSAGDWGFMAGLCAISALAQWLFIRTYEVAEASVVQPFAYLQLVFAAAIGVVVFDETLRINVAIGAAVVIAAGLVTLWRQHRADRHGQSRR
ncbi:MAG: DMT family transporter [Jannaschia sp.]